MTINKVVAEFIGTFLLVFIGTATAVFAGSGILSQSMGILAIAFAFGFTLMAVIYAIGPVSGAHVNPAVTIAMLLAKKISAKESMFYIVAQIFGAIIASALLWIILSGVTGASGAAGITFGLGANDVPSFITPISALLLEIILTFALVFVIFGVTAKDSGHAGLAIGSTLFVAHLIGVPLGDSSLNPARSIGPALLQGGTALVNVWVFIAGPIIGALIAVLVAKVIFAKA